MREKKKILHLGQKLRVSRCGLNLILPLLKNASGRESMLLCGDKQVQEILEFSVPTLCISGCDRLWMFTAHFIALPRTLIVSRHLFRAERMK